MQPLISVITPTYNHEQFVGECIESVLAQTYENWEQIVVDDGSTDCTWEVVQRYASKDKRIKLFRQANKGIFRLAETYNFALSQSRGQLLAILEGDDYWPEYKLSEQRKLHNSTTLLSYGDTLAVHNNGNTQRRLIRPPFIGILDNTHFLSHVLLRKSAIQPVSAVINSEKIKHLGGFYQDDFPATDFPTFIRLAQLPGEVVFEPRVFGFWRQHDRQITAQKGVEMIEGRLRIALEQFILLSTEMRSRLNLSEHDIKNAHRSGLADSYFVAVRAALKQQDRMLLDKYLPELWRYGNTKRKAQALYSWAAARLGFDMEPILKLFERAHT